MQRFKRFGYTVTFLAIGLTGWLAAQAMSGGMAFDISAGAATTTLKEFATQAHLQLLFDYRAVSKLKTPAVKGQLTPTEALKELLSGSGFTFREINDHTIAITAPGASTSSTGTQDQIFGTEPAKEGKTESSTAFLLAQATSGQASGTTSVESPQKQTQSSEVPIQEVIVTAQKREEKLSEVPVPVTVVNVDTLVDNNQTRLQDYYTSVPGLDLALDNRGAPAIAIRGITTTIYGNPTVGVTIDDVPFGATTASAFQWAATDFDPNELSRVEVLRGPQGTLYGASSLGGLIKYETVDPSFDGPSGRVQAGLTNVYNGNSPGYSVSGAANVPLSESVALRVSAFNRLDPGYITDTETGQSAVNWGDVDGARLSALWRPSANVSLKFSALIQDGKTYGSPNIEAVSPFGDLQQSYVRGTGGYDRELQAYDLVLRATWGPIDLTAITGYGISTSQGSFDVSSLSFVQGVAEKQFGAAGAAWVEDNKTNKFSQELRLSGPLGPRFDWLVGLFYTDESTDLNGGFQAFDPLSGDLAGVLFDQYGPVRYTEYAAFTDLTYHVTDQFDVQFGGRESHNRQTYSAILAGVWAPAVYGVPSPIVTPETESRDNSFTYLVTPRLRLSPDFMVYARLASGYRPGGPNTTVTPGSGLPMSFGPDKTENYELGLKGDFFEHLLSVDTSIYYIKWKDMQINVSDTANAESYATNLGQAKSQGEEIAVEARPFKGFSISAWGTWDNAVLTEAFPANSSAVGAVGDRLPYSARFSGALTVRQDLSFSNGVTGFGAASLSYVGEREGEFSAGFGAGRQVYPAYSKGDVRVGATYDSWLANIYVNNVSNQRGAIAGGLGTLNPIAFTYIQPRTIGLAVVKTF